MQMKDLKPMSVPTAWHKYLYSSILLPWEISIKNSKNFPRYVRNELILGVRINKVSNANEVLKAWEDNCKQAEQKSFITFFGNEAAFKDLFRLLRNCVAHGHYAQSNNSQIIFLHEHSGKLKLCGHVKFSELKSFVAFIHSESSYPGNVPIN